MERYRVEQGEDGLELVDIPLRGSALLRHNAYNRGTAFTHAERDALGLAGLLPHRVSTIDDQVERAYRHVMEQPAPLQRYVALRELEADNQVLYHRVLLEHLETLLPFVYTPTVGEACQRYSHIFRRSEGIWITPAHRGRMAQVLRNAPFEEVRLICVTDNERILGLGDLGAGGMGIAIGKLALYTAAAGLHPTWALPICLDVGTDNEKLLEDPAYLGWRERRLRGSSYDELVEELVTAIQEVFPRALLHWEDFKKANALHLLDRYRERILSFNDDIQGTAGVALAGIVAASRISNIPMEAQRVVMVGAGGAGIGVARIVRAELERLGVDERERMSAIAVLDSRGLVAHEPGRPRTDYKAEVAWPVELARSHGLASGSGLVECVRALRPTVLIGASGQPGVFSEEAIRAMAATVDRPAIFPFSNPNSKAEAHPEQIVRWTEGRALIASGSPFDEVEYQGRTIAVGQGNNLYVYPGVGMGALASGARQIVDSMFAVAAHAIGEQVSDDALARGQLYPPISQLRTISRAVALAVGMHAVELGIAPACSRAELERRLDAMTWIPRYPTIRL